MPHRPVIGIATQTFAAVPGTYPPCWVMGQRYVHALREQGAIPWLVPLIPEDEPTLRAIYERLDGLFLTGGVDVDPANYGEAKASYCGSTDPDRDAVELLFLKWSMQDRKPVLAVCRGIQALNVACGGTLYQDLASQVPEALKHDHFPTAAEPNVRDRIIHDVSVARDTRLGRILGSERVPVNSMHHQAIKTLGRGLIPSAVAPDGLIEGVEGQNGQYLIAVQWHPEELAAKDAAQRRLFTSFLEAC